MQETEGWAVSGEATPHLGLLCAVPGNHRWLTVTASLEPAGVLVMPCAA